MAQAKLRKERALPVAIEDADELKLQSEQAFIRSMSCTKKERLKEGGHLWARTKQSAIDTLAGSPPWMLQAHCNCQTAGPSCSEK